MNKNYKEMLDKHLPQDAVGLKKRIMNFILKIRDILEVLDFKGAGL